MNKIKIERIEETSNWTSTSKNGKITEEQIRRNCRCLIDTSSPAALERDFYAWLNGIEPDTDISRPCLFATNSSSFPSTISSTTTPIEESPAFLIPMEYSASIPSTIYYSSSSSSSSAASSSSISPGNSNIFCNNSSIISSCSHQIGFYNHLILNNNQQQQSTTVKRARNNQNNYKNECSNNNKVRRKRNVDKASGRGTNLYGRSYCPGRPLSMEERAKIIQLFHGGMKVNAISKQLCISHGCVSKIITRFRETGNLMPSSHSECRRRKRQQQQMQVKQQTIKTEME
uniref:Paired domain-containing protein n=1 Tax=Meloidogyne enterolobii TaxID=390850 RepID=A0A6V7X602_MELEN|nr:unnamed protein product [Meloidogyne enterolobii]